jgi:Protein of unknown function (DUF3159)
MHEVDARHGVGSSDQSPTTGWRAVQKTWTSRERLVDIGAAAAPSVVFLAVAALGSLDPAITAAVATGLLVFAARLLRHESLRSALIGLAIVAVCAGGAVVTGQERGYFLVPVAIPFVVVGVCLVTVLVRRPFTGLLFNRITGGPANWYEYPSLRGVHTSATWVAIAINVVNAAVQAFFYAADMPAILAIAHVATGPLFATLAAVTLVAARRAVNRLKDVHL